VKIKTTPLVARGLSLVNRCTVTDSLWNRYADCRSSWNRGDSAPIIIIIRERRMNVS